MSDQRRADTQLVRAVPTDLEIRGDGRTIVGISVPFDDPTEIHDAYGSYMEVVKRGSFARTIAERGSKVKLLVEHGYDARLPIGRATLLREDPRGLYSEFRVSKTDRGDEALELVRDGTLDSLSVGFRVVRQNWDAAYANREILEAALHEVSVVSFPAYEGAQILAVRAASAAATPHLAAARMRLDLIKKAPVYL